MIFVKEWKSVDVMFIDDWWNDVFFKVVSIIVIGCVFVELFEEKFGIENVNFYIG